MQFSSLFKKFTKNQSGETSVQATLIFSLAVMIGVLVGVPMLNTASTEYAHIKKYGIDPVQTSSVGARSQPVKRYTVRKSIFDVQDTEVAPNNLDQ